MCGAREYEALSGETVTMQDYPFSANRKLGEQVGREPVYPPRAALWTPLWLPEPACRIWAPVLHPLLGRNALRQSVDPSCAVSAPGSLW